MTANSVPPSHAKITWDAANYVVVELADWFQKVGKFSESRDLLREETRLTSFLFSFAQRALSVSESFQEKVARPDGALWARKFLRCWLSAEVARSLPHLYPHIPTIFRAGVAKKESS